MGRPELAEDPRYATAEERIESRDEIYETIEAWAATIATADELVSVLAGAQIVAARVRDYSETAVDPHLIARGTLAPVEIPSAASIDYYGMIDASGRVKPRVGDSVVFGFRPQAFVTRGYVVGVSGLSSSVPTVETIYDAFGRPAEWPI